MSSSFASDDCRRRLLTLALILFFGLSTRVAYASTSVDLQTQVNADLQTQYTNGSNYPSGGTILTNGNVSFTLAYGPNGTSGTGTLQTGPFNPSSAVNIPVSTSTFDIKVNIADPGTVYTLINSAYGLLNQTIGSVEFKATGGLDYTVNLVEGQNIRDHNNDGWNNLIGSGSLGHMYINTFSFAGGQVRLDEQAFVLPTSFQSATLTDIILNGTGNPDGEPFLAAATVTSSTETAVPEPPSLVMVSLVVGMVAGWRRRNGRNGDAAKSA